MMEQYYEKLLHIHSGGREEAHRGFHYYRYEPTPYNVLERLFERYSLSSDNRVVDFGCGKGRFPIFVHHLFQAATVGVEMDETLFGQAQENLASYTRHEDIPRGRIQFYCGLAEEYRVHRTDDRFYFFNPFSVQIFMKVIRNILASYEKRPREMDVLMYYPSEDYIYYLENETPFTFHTQVTLDELYGINPYERFAIYRLNA